MGYTNEDRAKIRDRALAIIEANGWTNVDAESHLGVSSQTIARMKQNGERWHGLASRTVARLVAAMDRIESDVHPVRAEVIEADQNVDLPIARYTGMLTARLVDGQEVFTYKDIAEGFQVDPDRVRQAFSNHASNWPTWETGVSVIYTPSGAQEVRWFPRRGAMRFCRYIRTGRSDQLFDHLLDLDQAQAFGAKVVSPRDDKLDAILAMLAGKTMVIESQVNEAKQIAEAAMAEVSVVAANIDPDKITADAISAVELNDREKGFWLSRLDSAVSDMVGDLIAYGRYANNDKGRNKAYSHVNGMVKTKFNVSARRYLSLEQIKASVPYVEAEHAAFLGGRGQSVIQFKKEAM